MNEANSVVAVQQWFRQLAHDLRQPLSTIDSTAYLLRLTNGDSAELIRMQELIQQASQLISDATTLIEPPECHLEPIALAGVVEKRLKQRLPSEQERIVFEAGIQPTVRADRVQIGRLVDSLLSVGLGANEEQGKIRLSLVAPARMELVVPGGAMESRGISLEALRVLSERQEAVFSRELRDSKMLLAIELRRM